MNEEDGQIFHAIFNMLDALFQQRAEADRLGATNPTRERALLAYQDWLEQRKARLKPATTPVVPQEGDTQ